MKSYAQIAYEAYCEDRRWYSFRGEPLPPWHEVESQIKDGWEAASQAIIEEYERRNEKDE
jgi:hypothetical protein